MTLHAYISYVLSAPNMLIDQVEFVMQTRG